ncbi:MAG: hypothetical protein HRU19_14515 [Pseudobacteriovorax sp.]|nr:hypothetical protein [Pseudobacteriovorax sp.]
MRSTWEISSNGVDIRVVNSWWNGAKLYIDNDLKDFDRSLFAFASKPLLTSSYANENEEKGVVKVYLKSNMLTVGIKITVDSKAILEDRYH